MPRLGLRSPVRGHRCAVNPAFTDAPHSGAVSRSDTFDTDGSANGRPGVECSNHGPIGDPFEHPADQQAVRNASVLDSDAAAVRSSGNINTEFAPNGASDLRVAIGFPVGSSLKHRPDRQPVVRPDICDTNRRPIDPQQPPKHRGPNQHPVLGPIEWRSNYHSVGCSHNAIANGRAVHFTRVIATKWQPDGTADSLTGSPAI